MLRDQENGGPESGHRKCRIGQISEQYCYIEITVPLRPLPQESHISTGLNH
ncbi:hypothetical protein GR197_14050 [Rhizobium phaseoli]|uniref:Uncharacterized protein n=1 Tax=Rhizobium phaseoli TaxID=396 RepID=A0A7K3UDB3_9HYPH|nr:hypothetical protein [Rhizobium phaseoli]NEJ71653.1 hypothetical protein [Rhizobium phaseoli]